MEEDSGSSREMEKWNTKNGWHTPKEHTHCTGVCLAYAQVNISLLKSTERFEHF